MKLTTKELRQIIREEIQKMTLNESWYDIILQQLGGNKFISMTGAKQFTKKESPKEFRFRIGGGAKKGINMIKIILTGKDLYDIEFLKAGKSDFKIIQKELDVQAEDLQDVFMGVTGFDTRL